MALPIKPIPTLTGELAEDFVRKAEENAKRRGTKVDEEQQRIMRSILTKSKINQADLDLEVLESKLDDALDSETEESLTKWLTDKRVNG